MSSKFELWWIPTRLAITFNWQPTLLGVFNTREEANEAAYIDRADEPATDKDAYMVWHIHKQKEKAK